MQTLDFLNSILHYFSYNRKIEFVFPLSKIVDMVDKGTSTVKGALNELETAGLVERRRCGSGIPNRIYVKQPDSQEIALMLDRKPTIKGPGNWPRDGQKIGRYPVKKLAPIKIGKSLLAQCALVKKNWTRK